MHAQAISSKLLIYFGDINLQLHKIKTKPLLNCTVYLYSYPHAGRDVLIFPREIGSVASAAQNRQDGGFETQLKPCRFVYLCKSMYIPKDWIGMPQLASFLFWLSWWMLLSCTNLTVSNVSGSPIFSNNVSLRDQ